VSSAGSSELGGMPALCQPPGEWLSGHLRQNRPFRYKGSERESMARWPRNARTTIFTYAAIFVLFPLLSWLAWLWVQGRLP